MTQRILVVEDSATQAEALRALLEEAGYGVIVARSGEAGLQAVAAESFDLVLSDIVMPGISGYEFCRRVKDEPESRWLPVLLLTSLADPMDIVRGLEAGADNYITKPYEPEHLLARVRHVLDNRRLRRGGRTSMGVTVSFLGTELTITSEKEQILDLLLSSIEDVIRTNRALEESRQQLANAHAQLEAYAREKAREAQLSTERYRVLMQSAGDAIFVLDEEDRVVEANDRARRLLGRGEAELVGRPLESFVAPDPEDDTAETGRRARLVVESPEGTVYCEATYSDPIVDGERLVLASLRDVTERKRADEALRRREAQLAEAQRIARIGSWDYDVATETVTWSEEGYRIFGLDPACGGLRLAEVMAIVHPEDRERMTGAVDDSSRTFVSISEEFRIIPADGSERILQGRGRVVTGPGGQPQRLTGTVQDITEQRLLETQLRQSQKMEAIGRLAGGVAHDFNNLLTVIKANTQLLLQDLTDGTLAADAHEVLRAADRAAALTQQLLAFSRRQVLQTRVVDLNGLVVETERMLRRVIGEDVELSTRLDEALWPVKADPGQLSQVLLNLSVNARDAMPAGGRLTITTRNVEFPSGREARLGDEVQAGAYVMLVVSDTGEGMPAEVRDRVFEPFFTTKQTGTGLGLATVYGIVRQSGGHIVVASEVGRGSRFVIYLPRTEETGEGGAVERPPAPARGSETILLVEDDDAVRGVIRRILERGGYRLLTATNGEEALRESEAFAGPVDLLITDVIMPGMNGSELSERLRAQRPELKVLFMSGYTDELIAHHGILEHGVNFTQKPFSPDSLAQKVREVLAQGGRGREEGKGIGNRE